MKKVLVVARDPVGAALYVVLKTFDAAQIVTDPADADVVLAFEREEVLQALKETTLTVWQVSVGGVGVTNKRVRRFDLLDAVPKLLIALRE